MVGIITFTKVKLPFGWMSNMSPHPIHNYLDKFWRTSEALFQALRFAEADPIRDLIRQEGSPMSAKMIAKKFKDKMVIEPQSQADLDNMHLVLQLKLNRHSTLLGELRATGDAQIIEDVTKRPHGSGLFWGAALQDDGTWLGENHLGKLWMEIRG